MKRSRVKHEKLFKQAYAEYGWVGDGKELVVSQSSDKTVSIPDGAWSTRPCCAQRTTDCLYTACPEKLHNQPNEVSWETLLKVHPQSHLDLLQTNRKVLLDVFEVYSDTTDVTKEDVRSILTAARRDTGGSILAAAIAYVHGFCMSLCGGHHHASTECSEGAGIFADVPLSWIILRETIQKLGIKQDPKALYLDVDVHHANGFAHCLNVFDDTSLKFLSIAKPFHSGTKTNPYLKLLKDALDEAEKNLPLPDIIYYMANNDILKGDPLGQASITPNGIFKRDQMVLNWARRRGIPIVMIVGAGYAENGCKVTRDNLLKLNKEFGLWNNSSNSSKKKNKIVS